jgi:hypothetical protein
MVYDDIRADAARDEPQGPQHYPTVVARRGTAATRRKTPVAMRSSDGDRLRRGR